jgi:hypothetical protein
MYSSYSFSTSALDGGEWSASRPGRTLSLGKGHPVPTVQEAGWVPEPVWEQRLQEKSFRRCRGSNFDRPVVHPVARHYFLTLMRNTLHILCRYACQENDKILTPYLFYRSVTNAMVLILNRVVSATSFHTSCNVRYILCNITLMMITSMVWDCQRAYCTSPRWYMSMKN